MVAPGAHRKRRTYKPKAKPVEVRVADVRVGTARLQVFVTVEVR